MKRRARHRDVWSGLGDSDPDWGVLTVSDRRGGGWTHDLDAFYATGEADVAEALSHVDGDLGHDRALDFGSGTGRLTFALARRFASVTAVDVSEGMLATLRTRAAERGLADRVRPTHVDQLHVGGDHDLAFSLLVLQHLESRAAIGQALARLAATLRPGGWLVVEVPERGLGWKQRVQPRWQLYRIGRALGVSDAALQRRRLSGISMVTMPQPAMDAALAAAGVTTQTTRLRADGEYDYRLWIARR